MIKKICIVWCLLLSPIASLAEGTVFDSDCRDIYSGITQETAIIFEAIAAKDRVFYRQSDQKSEIHEIERQREGSFGYEHLGNSLSSLSKHYALTPTNNGFLVEDSVDDKGDYAVISVDFSEMKAERTKILPEQISVQTKGWRQHSANTPYRNSRFWTYPVGNGANILILDIYDLDNQAVVHAGQYKGVYLDDDGKILASIRLHRGSWVDGLYFEDELHSFVEGDNNVSLYQINKHPVTGESIEAAALLRTYRHSIDRTHVRHTYELISIISGVNTSEPKFEKLENFTFSRFEYDGVSRQFLWFEKKDQSSGNIDIEFSDYQLGEAVKELHTDGWKKVRLHAANADFSKVILITQIKDKMSNISGYTLLERQSPTEPYERSELCYSEGDERLL